MKLTRFIPALSLAAMLTINCRAQTETGIDSTGLPGDNFSLQGALSMFQKASSPEDFEKLINSENNHVNNLDLNEDGEIDYIRVIDKTEKDVHAFVLQAVVSADESQDIAVIELERTSDTTVVLQIVGDEDIYGETVIIEPGGNDDETGSAFDFNSSVAHGPDAGHYYDNSGIIVNVWLWPSVRFVYAPAYRPWASPWRWRHYPGWWRPWKALTWRAFHPFHARYRKNFVVVHTHRVMRAHTIYRPHRVSSVTVRTRHATAVNGYRVTRTKTTVTGPRGNQATRTKTTIRSTKGRKGRR